VYFNALPVVLDCIALLQAVKKQLEAVVKVLPIAGVETIYINSEAPCYLGIPQGTLQEEFLLVFLNCFSLA
jgi:hypothetical protein